MATSIITTGTTTDPVTTNYDTGDTTREWVNDHDNAVSGSTPSGNKLTTTWPSAAGQQTVNTTRNTGESDADFRARHMIAYLEAMLDAPPEA